MYILTSITACEGWYAAFHEPEGVTYSKVMAWGLYVNADDAADTRLDGLVPEGLQHGNLSENMACHELGNFLGFLTADELRIAGGQDPLPFKRTVTELTRKLTAARR